MVLPAVSVATKLRLLCSESIDTKEFRPIVCCVVFNRTEFWLSKLFIDADAGVVEVKGLLKNNSLRQST